MCDSYSIVRVGRSVSGVSSTVDSSGVDAAVSALSTFRRLALGVAGVTGASGWSAEAAGAATGAS